MKEKLWELACGRLEEFNVRIDDVFIETVENHPVLNVVVDSDEVIDLDKVTEVSRVINEIIDTNDVIKEDFDEVDVYTKSKGEDYEK